MAGAHWPDGLGEGDGVDSGGHDARPPVPGFVRQAPGRIMGLRPQLPVNPDPSEVALQIFVWALGLFCAALSALSREGEKAAFSKGWLGFLDAFRTLCIDSKGEIRATFESLRNTWPVQAETSWPGLVVNREPGAGPYVERPEERRWRATVDEDGHYSFAVPL